MSDLFGAILSRDGLAAGLTRMDAHDLHVFSLSELRVVGIPSRGAFIGRWGSGRSDPLPEIIVVRDEDYSDTLAWLGSYFTALAPLTQWCRILPLSRAASTAGRSRPSGYDIRLGPWVGAILAECSAQAGGGVNLRDLPGTAALSSSTYAAGRADAVWGPEADLREIARRHDEVSSILRSGPRPIAATAMLPLWHAIAGNGARELSSAIRVFAQLLDEAYGLSRRSELVEIVAAVADRAASAFGVSTLLECARGTQSDRVRALDSLANDLGRAAASPDAEALLGLAASLVEPGTAVLPDLFGRYASRFPLAPLWLGAFAGAMAPLRVLSEQQGLGRLISKAMLAEPDLETRPLCDISYEEVSRWFGPVGSNLKIAIRGMAARSVSIELSLGVTCSFAYGRAESPVQSRDTTRTEEDRPPARYGSAPRSNYALADAVVALTRRVDQLENLMKAQAERQPELDLDPNGTSSQRKSQGRKK